MMYCARLVVLLMLAVVWGCGDGGSTSAPPPKPPMERIRASLETVATSESFGSEAGEMFKAIEELKKSDPATAETLRSQANDMMRLSGPQRQAKAKEMLTSLPGAAPAASNE